MFETAKQFDKSGNARYLTNVIFVVHPDNVDVGTAFHEEWIHTNTQASFISKDKYTIPQSISYKEATVLAPTDCRLDISVTSEDQKNLDFTFDLITKCLLERDCMIDDVSKAKEYSLQLPKTQQTGMKSSAQPATNVNNLYGSKLFSSSYKDSLPGISDNFATKANKTFTTKKENSMFAAACADSTYLTRDVSSHAATSLGHVCHSELNVSSLNSDFDLPPNWTAMGDNENLKMVKLKPSDPEYIEVEEQFKSWENMHHKNILQIDRIQNRYLYKRYIVKKKFIDSRNRPGQDNESTLWHGTDMEAITSINTYGFDRNYCGKNGNSYGNGVYFAVDPSYSAKSTYARPDASKTKRIYMCKVLVGDYTKGHYGMKVLPPNPNASDPNILCDSVVDNVRSPMIFVIFQDDQAYPSYLISFDN